MYAGYTVVPSMSFLKLSFLLRFSAECTPLFLHLDIIPFDLRSFIFCGVHALRLLQFALLLGYLLLRS